MNHKELTAMIKEVRGSGWTAVAGGAIALLAAASCADVADDAAPVQQTAQAVSGPARGQGKALPYATDRILVRFKSGTAASRTAAVHAQHSGQVVREYRVPTNLQLVMVPQGAAVEQMVEAYRRDPEVLYAEPNYIYQLATVPNDPSFG